MSGSKFVDVRTPRNRAIGWLAAIIIGTLIWTLIGFGVAAIARADDAVVPEVEVSTPAEAIVQESTEVVEEVLPVVEEEPVVSAARVQDEEPQHIPTTFCHKPGEHNQQELTTDDDGFLQGHLGHGDALGACLPLVVVPQNVTEWHTWLVPTGVVPVPSGDPRAKNSLSVPSSGFPQAYVGSGRVAAAPGTCVQQDEYTSTRAIIDGVIVDSTLTNGEDHAIVTNWYIDCAASLPPEDEEPETYTPSCSSIEDNYRLPGTGVFTVDGDWDSVTYEIPFSGTTLADLGTLFNIEASPLQYVGLHVHTSLGTIVFEEEDSYAGKLWSSTSWPGVGAGMGYPAFGTIQEFVALNGPVLVSSIDLLYTHPEESTTTVASFVIGCAGYTFVVPTDEPTEEPTPDPTPTETTPVPTPTETTPVPTPSATTPVVVEVANVATPTAAKLASTGSNGDGILALIAFVLVIGGATLLSLIKRQKSTQI